MTTTQQESSRQNHAHCSLPKRKLGDVNISDRPRNSTIARRHFSRDTLCLTQCLIVVRIRRVQRDDGIDPRVCRHGAAVLLGALDGTAPAERVAVAGRKGRHVLTVAGDDLCVVARVVVVLVCADISELLPSGVRFSDSQCMVILSPAAAVEPSA